MKYYDKLIFELSRPGRSGYSLPKGCGKGIELPEELSRQTPLDLPEVSEVDVVRHYTNLSQMNFGVDTGFYPLGSCTMKYNPKINEEIAAHPLFTGLHPLQPAETVKGAQEVIDTLDKALAAITGFEHFTFLPCAGAHGELTGLMLMREYHMARGDAARTKVIVPDSAHGTNPASAAVCGLEIVVVKSRPDGPLTSAMSLAETAVSIFMDRMHVSRPVAGVITMAIIIGLGLVCCLGFGPWMTNVPGDQGAGWLGIFDTLTNSFLMPITAILTCIFIGFVVKTTVLEEEIELNGPFKAKMVFRVMIKYICPLCLLAILISGMYGTFFT